ncbi:hypothetical protein IVB45_07850 [Bradyrhizobium sp. 4]|uniref:hypothetical protein n=1 Tax=unclassified Bradyrhizobium TaxID=2631580 RepID=UPI001FF8153A|nr:MULTISPECIES: hypothetical protein [unclassified Bradyrhizobium]MCK1397440.1 hypothetical protein [Bradyrhizobium sp. 39]MCK1752521.1 hypothetical protein [Bradyrhizobium sp. 135]UPJ36740.1 hypothetical protein IVB45_07850 [Bradyrhizobium sp. 4]
MKSLPVFLAVVAFLLWARATRTSWLFFGWGFLVTGLPLLRGLIGPIPIYLFDVAVCLVWSVVLLRPGEPAWPQNSPPWMPLFLAILTIFGTLLPMFTYGVYPEMIWNLGHTGLAMTTIVLGAFMMRGATDAERNGLRLGIVAGLFLLAIIAILQKSSAGSNAVLVRLFYGDEVGGDDSYSVIAAEALSALGRVSGPFGSPNTFGIVALMAALNYWLITTVDRRKSLLNIMVFGSLVAIIIASGSRQAILAAGLIGLGYAMTTSPTKMLPSLVLGGGLIGTVLLFVDASALLERLGRLSQGTDEANVSARVAEGPQRFWEMLAWDPSLLFTGVGLEIQKLARYNIAISSEILDGFVSNGYLLYIYFFGLFGFLVMTAFWIWVAYRGLVAPRSVRHITTGGGIALIFIIFADNHAVLAEELLNQIMIFAGFTTALTAHAASGLKTGSPIVRVPLNARRSSH